MKQNFSVYVEGCIYPATTQSFPPVATTIVQLQKSGFNTAILGLFHIGRNYAIQPSQIMGDIYFNDTLIISEGCYVGDSNWPALVNGLPAGTVSQVCASFGGGGVMDFQTIQRIYQSNGNSFSGTTLESNFEVLRNTFPAIGIVDMDCEETYDQTSFVAFCQMLAGLGFGITFCPYTNTAFWAASLAALNNSNPGAVKWWNLQCYDGGFGNTPAAWAEAIEQAIPTFSTIGYFVVGDWTNDGPGSTQALMSSFTDKSAISGGFMWTLDNMITANPQDPQSVMTAFVDAISEGLGSTIIRKHL
ncbi:MAG: hypothetical protein V4732_16475 [Pseudomonadota bacterium]